MFFRSNILLPALVALAAAGVSGPALGEALAQQSGERVAVLSRPEVRSSPVVERGDYLVVVDLDVNELHFMQGRTVLWSAPVGTGMDLRLETGDRRWQFSTPTGEYQVLYKEENPVWVAPDWFFIENKRPVPPQNDPARRFPGALGVAAVHFGRGLAIHGTDKPDLLGQRVSHGCIRIANEYAQRLFHNVQIGTKILIVGSADRGEAGELIPGQVPGAGPVDARTQRIRDRAKAQRARMMDELTGMTTAALLDRLADETDARDARNSTDWPETASVLIGRAITDSDEQAARGLLERATSIRERQVRGEFATFVADLYRRATPVAAAALAGMDGRRQRAAAGTVVEATLGLFYEGSEVATAPWPSRRILREALAEEARPGWDAVQRAETDFRERLADTAQRRGGERGVRTGRL